MNNKYGVMISPNHVPLNATLTVKSAAESFADKDYIITDETGRIIRKGAIATGISEFKLSMVGMLKGAYKFTMGKVHERFIVL